MKSIYQILLFFIISFTVNAQDGTVLNFEGPVNSTYDYIEVADNNSLDFTNSFTFETWVNFDQITRYDNGWDWQCLFVKSRYNESYGLMLLTESSKILRFYHAGFGIGYTDFNWTSSLAAKTWYHIAVTFNGTKTSIYIDGTEVASQTNVAGSVVPNNNPLRIGANRTGGADPYPLQGTLDETRLWNYARSQTEISNTKDTELIGNESGLVLYYKYNQGIGAGDNTVITTVMDSSSQGNDGTLHQFALIGSTSNFITDTSNGVTVKQDQVSPTVVTQNLTVQLDATGNISITPVQIDNGSTDNFGIQSMSLDVTSFDCTNVGANTVTLTVTDVNGNSDSKTATVTVEDKVNPIVVTQNITVQLDATGNVSITPAQINNGSTDNCGIQSMSLDTTAFDCTNIGANTVTLTVTDINGNTNTNTATVTVEDKVNPIVVIQDITVQLDATRNVSITPAQIDNGSTDNCGIQSMSLDTTSFDCTNVGVNTVTLTVTDVNGNSDSKTATVTVEDKVNPTVFTRDITVQLDATGNISITPAQINNGSTDNCGIQSMNLDTTSFDCTNVGANTVTLIVTDINGNSNFKTAVVTVEDKVNPIVVTQNITVQLDATGNISIAPAQINNGSTDNCGIESMNLDVTSFDCTNVGVNTVTLTVTDVNGNSDSKTATVTVADVTEPIAITKDIVVELDVNGNATITPEEINNDSFDACGIQSLSLDKTTFNCPPLTAHLVVLTVTDLHGLSSTAEAEVTFVASDIDNDLIADVCDDDIDGDGVLNVVDNCVTTPNPDQRDLDKNGVGDVCDNGDLSIPKGFSPNGDGINDEFIINGLHKYPNNSIEILNRWGARVYRSTDYQNYWDGVGNGKSKKLPVGAYFYILSIDAGKQVLKGWIYINY